MQDVLAEAWREYRHNFKTGLAFLLLLVFVLPFLYLHGFYFSSGSVFADYDFAKLGVAELVVSLLALLAFLFAYSVFLTLTVFAVRKRYSAVKVHYFLSEQIHKFAFKVFAYLVIVLAAAWLTTVAERALVAGGGCVDVRAASHCHRRTRPAHEHRAGH